MAAPARLTNVQAQERRLVKKARFLMRGGYLKLAAGERLLLWCRDCCVWWTMTLRLCPMKRRIGGAGTTPLVLFSAHARWVHRSPDLVDIPPARLRGYAHEAVVAGIFQIKVDLGKADSGIADNYDLRIISEAFEINRPRLAQAISAFFVRRGTAIRDEVPEGWSPSVEDDPVVRRHWESSERELGFERGPLVGVIGEPVADLTPAATTTRDGTRRVGAEQ